MKDAGEVHTVDGGVMASVPPVGLVTLEAR
jgi:hypothetical protein